ncbi:hypothetical protein OSB04_013815 [Centaurea solstitialis]|uniref:Dirigent protein n=1 Tax=Centaurea solstitialis TaxID=347529 RepID=A0AA38TRW5_9ASTR|nr:hypothetical protein OSB04_013815 [Centaurea solstitialis]
MPVVGGSGLFRFARGYAQAKTHSFDFKTGNAVVEAEKSVITDFITALWGYEVLRGRDNGYMSKVGIAIKEEVTGVQKGIASLSATSKLINQQLAYQLSASLSATS